jgi:hypothetical protein
VCNIVFSTMFIAHTHSPVIIVVHVETNISIIIFHSCRVGALSSSSVRGSQAYVLFYERDES